MGLRRDWYNREAPRFPPEEGMETGSYALVYQVRPSVVLQARPLLCAVRNPDVIKQGMSSWKSGSRACNGCHRWYTEAAFSTFGVNVPL